MRLNSTITTFVLWAILLVLPVAAGSQENRAGDHGANTGKGFYDWSDPRKPKARDMSAYVVGTAEDMLATLK